MSGSSASSHAGFSKLKFRNSTLELLNDILECQIGWPGKEKKNIKVWKMRRKVRDLNFLGKSSTTGSISNSKGCSSYHFWVENFSQFSFDSEMYT